MTHRMARTEHGRTGTVVRTLAHTDVVARIRWFDGGLSWHRVNHSTDVGRTVVVCPVALSAAQLHRAVA